MNAYASVQEQGSYTRVCDRHGRWESSQFVALHVSTRGVLRIQI